MRRVAVLSCCWAAAALPCGATSARAQTVQTVRGTVTGRDDGAPLAGVVVTVLDSAKLRVAVRLTSDDGAFEIGAVPLGAVTLRVERVGYATVESPPFAIAAGATITRPFVLAPAPFAMRPVRVSTSARCVVRPAAGAEAAELWVEARKVLAAASATQREHRYVLRVRHFTREMDPTSGRTLRDEAWERDTQGAMPFVTDDTLLLARAGYVRRLDSGGYVYSAPDAELLLSDFFLDGHCFRPQPSSDATRDLTGLAFEPVAARRRPDIAGTLWLDRATGALRRIDFRYVNLDLLDADLDAADGEATRAGGTVALSQLPNGRWAVGDWHVRMPVRQRGRASFGGRGDAIRTSSTVAMKVAGATLVGARAVGRGPNVRFASVNGVLFDSLRGRPVAGAAVTLARDGADLPLHLRTSPTGTLSIPVLAPGMYTAQADLTDDEFFRPPPSRRVAISDTTTTLALAYPPLRTEVARLCGAGASADSMALLVGLVRSAPDSGIAVAAVWQQVDRRRTTLTLMAVETRTDASGRYVICGAGIPPDVRVRLLVGPRRPPAAGDRSLILRPGTIQRVDLNMSSAVQR